uniref:RRM domain-containing protein n=1 Tax=Strongyloides stercoralis TaxID=6248 RepID=A0A0K0ECN9_STRER
MDPQENNIFNFLKKFNINISYENNSNSKDLFQPSISDNVKNSHVQLFDKNIQEQPILYLSNTNYEENDKRLIEQPFFDISNNQEMAGVVRHNLPCPPSNPTISYTNFHIETSVEIISNGIFVGGLNESIGEDDLTRLFQKYGKVLNSKIIRSSNNISKGYGFVTFVDDVSATKVKNLANQESNKFSIGGCTIIVKDARKKGIVRQVTRCAIPNFHISSPTENPASDVSQSICPDGEHQQVLSLQNDGLIRSQNSSSQQFITPPQTPTNVSPPLPPTFVPPFGYYQYPYQYSYNPYFQVNPPPYQIYQYTHVTHPHNYPYTQQYIINGNYGNEHEETPIVTMESDDEGNS